MYNKSIQYTRTPPLLFSHVNTGNVSAITEYTMGGGNLYTQDEHGNPPLHVVSQELTLVAIHTYCKCYVV